jgi:hypothetical protein
VYLTVPLRTGARCFEWTITAVFTFINLEALLQSRFVLLRLVFLKANVIVGAIKARPGVPYRFQIFRARVIFFPVLSASSWDLFAAGFRIIPIFSTCNPIMAWQLHSLFPFRVPYPIPQMPHVDMIRIVRVILFPTRPFEFVNQCGEFVRIRFKPKLAFHVPVVTKENFPRVLAKIPYFLQLCYYRFRVMFIHHPPADRH